MRSELVLPAAPDNTSRTVDLTVAVREGEAAPDPQPGARLLSEIDDPTHQRYHAVRDAGGHWMLDFGAAARVRIGAGGRRVVVWPGRDSSAGLLSVLVAGPVLTAVSMLRRRPLLHASSVVLDPVGGSPVALAFAGPSGAGKSTMARLLADHAQAGLLSDDATYLEVTDRGVVAHAGTRLSRLRTSVLATPGAAREVGHSPDGRITLSAGDTDTPLEARALAVVVPLLSSQFTELVAEVLRGAEALAALAFAEPLAGLVDAELRTAHFGHCARIAARLQVVRLEVPWQREGLDLAAVARSARGVVVDALART